MPWSEELGPGRYRAAWRDAQGRRRSKASFSSRRAALAYAGEQEAKARRGEILETGRSPRWSEWCAEWQELRVVEASTADAERARLGRYVLPRWGDVRLAQISRSDVQAWVNELAEGDLAPSSVVKVFHILSASLVAAVKHGRLTASPCDHVDLPKIPPGGPRYLTPAEVEAVLSYVNEPYRTGLVLLVGAGLRFGELAGLHWSRVDLGAGLLEVVEIHDATIGRIRPYPKSRRQRTMPIPSWVAEALDTLPRTGASSCGLPHSGRGVCRSDLVIKGPLGGALNEHNVRSRHWLPALEQAGLGHARLHDLRHTYASWLVQAGRSLQEVADLLGHQSLATTMRYAHLSPARFDRAREALEGYAPRAETPKGPALLAVGGGGA